MDTSHAVNNEVNSYNQSRSVYLLTQPNGCDINWLVTGPNLCDNTLHGMIVFSVWEEGAACNVINYAMTSNYDQLMIACVKNILKNMKRIWNRFNSRLMLTVCMKSTLKTLGQVGEST
jgi:hypothetical protein